MNDSAEGSFEALNMFRRAFMGSFFVGGLAISAAGFVWEGLILYLGIIFGALFFAAGFSGIPDTLVGFVARRRGALYMRVSALLMPLLSTAASLVIPLFFWLALRERIPLLWNHKVAILLFLLAALVSLGIFLSNIFVLIRGRTNT